MWNVKISFESRCYECVSWISFLFEIENEKQVIKTCSV